MGGVYYQRGLCFLVGGGALFVSQLIIGGGIAACVYGWRGAPGSHSRDREVCKLGALHFKCENRFFRFFLGGLRVQAAARVAAGINMLPAS